MTAPVKTRKSSVKGKSFTQRNTTVIGAVGLVVITILMWAAFNASKLPIVGGGKTYQAQFSESAGLVKNQEVRIAGVRVGQVTKVELDGDHVDVTFRVKKGFVGDQSRLAIKLKTLLGAKYLDVQSLGENAQDPGDEIPLSRTVSPFDVYPAFQGLTEKIGEIDTVKLAASLDVLADTMDGTSNQTVKTALNGLSRLSQTISSRDAQLRTLLANARNVTGILASRDDVLVKLITDSSLLLDELHNRREAIHTLFVNTSALSAQLRGLVADNEATIGPLLSQLDGVLQILVRNKDNIDRTLALMAPFIRVFTDVAGQGRWFDNYIQNLSIPGLIGSSLPIALPGGDSTVPGGN